MEAIKRTKIIFNNPELSLLKYWIPKYIDVDMFDIDDLTKHEEIKTFQDRVGHEMTIDSDSFKYLFHSVRYHDDYMTILNSLNSVSTEFDFTESSAIGRYVFIIDSLRHEISSIKDETILFSFENLDNISDFIDNFIPSFFDEDDTILITTKINLNKK